MLTQNKILIRSHKQPLLNEGSWSDIGSGVELTYVKKLGIYSIN